MHQKKVLVITPYLSSGGSEYIIKKLAVFLKKNNYDVLIYSYFNSSVNKELENQGIKCMYPRKKNLLIRLLEKVFNYKSEEKQLKKIQKTFKADFWFINTIVLPNVINLGNQLNVKSIMYLHESLMAIASTLVNDEFEITINYTDRIISVSKSAGDLFIEAGFPEKHVSVIPPFIQLDTNISKDINKINTLKRELKIPEDAFIIGMSGLTSFTKGFDRVVEICQEIKPLNGHFIWIGNPSNSSIFSITMNTLKNKGLNNFHFIGRKSHPEYYDYLNLMDVFTLTSRSDTFPLVMIEAAHFEIPVVAFDQTGAVEFIKKGMGTIVKNGDIKGMVEQAMLFLKQEEKSNLEDNSSYIQSFTNENSLKKIEKVINDTIYLN